MPKETVRCADTAARNFAVFFFQAEDGIRDLYVTGVQTCALPISLSRLRCTGAAPAPASPAARSRARRAHDTAPRARHRRRVQARNGDGEPLLRGRSEERRVGKECRSGSAEVDAKRNSTVR